MSGNVEVAVEANREVDVPIGVVLIVVVEEIQTQTLMVTAVGGRGPSGILPLNYLLGYCNLHHSHSLAIESNAHVLMPIQCSEHQFSVC